MKINAQSLLISGLLLAVVVRTNTMRRAQQIQDQTALADPGNWFMDQWSRLLGHDLSIDGRHPLPSNFDQYGYNSGIGLNGSMNTPGWAIA